MKKLIGLLLLLIVAYVVSYAFIVTPSTIPEVRGLPPWNRAPEYAIKSDLVTRIYAPALELDRKYLARRWQF